MRFPLLAGACLVASSLRAAPALSLVDPGFEDAAPGWTASADDIRLGLSKITAEAARSGKAGLRVAQPEGGPGSWFQSRRTPLSQGSAYRIEFWARTLRPSGAGVWVQFFDGEGRPLAAEDRAATAVQVPAETPEWTACRLDVVAPESAASMTLAVHCYSKRATLADFDDFTITPVAAGDAPAAASSVIAPDPARVREIASFLEPLPRGVGASPDDRRVWEELKSDAGAASTLLARAGRFLDEPIPGVKDAYAASVLSGDRKVDAAVNQRRFRLANFTLAEGMENQGRFLPAIAREIDAICAEESWILSGHVKFSGGRNDLGTAMTAWNLATAATMLGDRLPAATRQAVRDAVRTRVVAPYLDAIRGKTKPEWWSTDPNNWNAVVHGGVVGAALALTDSAEERAEIIAAAEIGTRFYIRGFPSDGYSTEGMGYWKYGFGHYVLLAETVRAATRGKVDFYARDDIRLVARFPRRFEIAKEVYPAFADALFMEQPSSWLFHIIDRRCGLGDRAPRSVTMDGMFSTFLYAWGVNLAFDSSAPPPGGPDGATPGRPLRDWFEQSQVLISRPAADGGGLGVAIKGGNNGVSHGHNDLGAYVVVRGRQPLLVDPGSTAYNAATFGPRRFENQVIGSYGHPVPLVAGQPQKTGSARAAVVLATDFTDDRDRIKLDLARGYEVPALRALTRQFECERAAGAVTVADHVEFSSPQAFGTALVTYGEAVEESPGVWRISQNGETVRVAVDAGGAAFTVTDEVLKDEARAGKVRRLGVNLSAPASAATITLRVTAP